MRVSFFTLPLVILATQAEQLDVRKESYHAALPLPPIRRNSVKGSSEGGHLATSRGIGLDWWKTPLTDLECFRGVRGLQDCLYSAKTIAKMNQTDSKVKCRQCLTAANCYFNVTVNGMDCPRFSYGGNIPTNNQTCFGSTYYSNCLKASYMAALKNGETVRAANEIVRNNAFICLQQCTPTYDNKKRLTLKCPPKYPSPSTVIGSLTV